MKMQLGTSFKYINYLPKTGKITIVTNLGDYADEDTLQQSVTNALNNYTDPLPVDSGSSIYVDAIASLTKSIISAKNVVDLNGNRITNVALPIDAFDSANRQYVDSMISPNAGVGITKTNSVFDVNVDEFSLEISPTNIIRIAATGIGTGLLGGSGSIISVDSNQSQITDVGTLNQLIVSGNTFITDSTDTTGISTGAFQVAGGAYFGKNVFISETLNMNNSRIVSIADPQSATDAANRFYVDSITPTARFGLISTVATDGTTTTTYLDINVDDFSLEIATNNVIRLSNIGLGTGLTGGSGVAIAVNPDLNLTSLVITDTLNVYGISTFLNNSVFNSLVTLLSTNDSSAPNTGSLVLSGGIGIGKSVSIGDSIHFPGNVNMYTDSSDTITSTLHINKPDNDLILSMETDSLSGYNTSIHLFNLGTENTTDGEYLEIASTAGGTSITTKANGSGTIRPLSIGSFLSINVQNGVIQCNGTQDSISSDTGALIISSGGMGVAGSVHIGAMLHVATGIDVNGYRITNVASPINPFDAVNRAYVESIAQGLSIKESVLVASTSPNNLNDIIPGFSIDDVTLTANDRILLKNQINPIENGIWIVSGTGSPTRADDMNVGSNAYAAFVFVESGTMNKASGWVNSTPGATDVVGTDALNFTQFSGAGQIVAGLAMSKTGNQLDVNVDNVSIEVYNDALRIASGAISTGLSGGSGNPISVNSVLSHVTGLGSINSGTWNANIITVSYGGTGVANFPVNSILIGNGNSPITSHTNFSYSNLNSTLSVANFSINATTASISPVTGALVVSGGTGILGDLYVNGNSNFTGKLTIPNPQSNMEASTKFYVDSLVSLAGTGLTKTGNIFSVNANQTQIVSLGTLSSLNVAGKTHLLDTTDATNSATGSLVVDGGIGIGKNLQVAGLVGFQSNLNVQGIINVTNTTASVSPITGSLVISGGVGISGSCYVGGASNFNSLIDTISLTTGSVIIAGGLSVNKSIFLGNNLYFSNSNIYLLSDTTAGGYGIRLRNTDSINTETRFTLANSGSSNNYTSRIRLFTFGTTTTTNQEYLEIASNSVGATLNWRTIGTGINRSLNVYNGALNISATGSIVSTGNGTTVSITSTIDSASMVTGAMTVAGGLGIGKNLTAATANIANLNLVPFQTTASWINLSSTGSSGIGTGGAGINAWIAYSSAAGNWFSNSAIGDICYRNTSGKLLFGNTTGAASLSLSNDNVGIGTVTPGMQLDVVGNTRINGILSNINTTDSTSTITGSIILSGGLGVGKTISVGIGIRLKGSTLGNVILSAPATVSPIYTLTMPSAPPAASGQYVAATNTTGSLTFTDPIISNVYNGTIIYTNVKIYTISTTTNGGIAIIHPTNDGTDTGMALFTNILTANAMAIENTTNAIQVPLCGLNSISADFRTIIFNVITGTIANNKQPGMQYVANGTLVQVTIIGI
jgi:hypothetical protein